MAEETKDSGVGIILSWCWTGLGQLYAGKILRGLMMMIATPIIWAVSFFGSGYSLLVVLAKFTNTIVQTEGGEGSGTIVAGGRMSILGIFLAPVALAWWIWGMTNAKKLCEKFNTAERSC